MRILLDESLPRGLGTHILGHEVVTVQAAGWSGIKNGKLLSAAAAQFDVFITADRNLQHQQNLATLPIAIIVLRVPRTRVESIQPLIPELLKVLNHLLPRTLRTVGV